MGTFARLASALWMAVALFPSPARAQAPGPTGVDACNQAIDLLDKDKPAEALAILERARGTMDPEDEWLWWGNCGLAHRDLRRDAPALEHFARAIELKKDCWFRFQYALLLHQFGRWDEALEALNGPIPESYADDAKGLRAVIEGPYRKKYPRSWRRFEYSTRSGVYRVVSDMGADLDALSAVEAEVAKLDPAKPLEKAKIEQLLKPSAQLVNVANMLELARKEYMRIAGMPENEWPKGKMFKVFFLRNKPEFDAFAGAVMEDHSTENLLGFYDPTFKYLQLFDQQDHYQICGIGKDTIDTFLHEGWHQFFDVLAARTPIWMNEGIAEYLGAADISADGRKLVLGTLIREDGDFVTNFEQIRKRIENGSAYRWKELFRITVPQWHAGDRHALYAQSWSIVYYAMKGNNEPFRRDFQKFFAEIRKGKPWREALELHLPEKKLDAYEVQWLEFMKKL